ncbi:hypothetical protein AMS68_007313 [Peltaster fructicola]|uniref:Peptidase S9 prolyl oligopeptidase catalytic domain-containing protein n=1 Tax=Peltaster fructicola TaxID=286661 RepID=A0A6H0Y4A8_9PEZI|nr:hypothetical protein AMS68_007313 [Peltaster fructicola]
MQLLRILAQQYTILQGLLSHEHIDGASSSISASEEWHVLGPFTLGTREATWGADPLEDIGGFQNLVYNRSSHFRSSLSPNGMTRWTDTVAQITDLGNEAMDIRLEIGYPEIDWTFLQQVYGWAALQWQGWARGYVTIDTADTQYYSLNVDHILELRIDDVHYFGGDYYGFHKVPISLRLSPGKHRFDIRLIRDVRSMGGMTSSPSIDVRLLLVKTTKALRQISQVLYPDRLVDWKGPLASTYASVVLHNDLDTDVFIDSLEAKHNACQAQLTSAIPIRLVPKQSRAIAFQIDCIAGTSAYLSIDLHFSYHMGTSNKDQHKLFVGILARPPVSLNEPHVITYLHPGGIVSYAILRPPTGKCSGNESLPVLLALHGAGVEADSDQAKHALDGVVDVCAWTLTPSGVTPWSGDDWHNWGWADVQAALAAIPLWIDKVDWTGPGVDISRWLVTGHSNGGQGVWYALTHHPDNIIAAAPISGYSSIQNYVPYTFWQHADPACTAIVQAQLNSYRHELLLDNVKGIPVFQQHGSLDDNVPAYHSRLMYDLVHRSGASSDYFEVSGKPHWWHGVMTTPPLRQFYQDHLERDSSTHQVGDFILSTASPGDTSSKHGLRILSLTKPSLLGRLHVTFSSPGHDNCTIRTENVDRFELGSDFLQRCSHLLVDAGYVDWHETNTTLGITIKMDPSGAWTLSRANLDDCTRAPQQHGGLEAILRSNGTIYLFSHSPGTENVATEIANNLMQYFSADVEVAMLYETTHLGSGNVISLAYGPDMPSGLQDCATSCRMDIDKQGRLNISTATRVAHSFDISRNNIVAAAFLRPLPDHRLELVFWGVDLASLRLSVCLLPLMTGSGQPDFVIATQQMLSRGLGGVFAMGFFDSSWCPSTASYFATDGKRPQH